MQTETDTHQLRRSLVEKITLILLGKAPKEDFIPLANTLSATPEVQTDTILQGVFMNVTDLAKQLQSERPETVTQEVLEDACIAMLDTLTAQPY